MSSCSLDCKTVVFVANESDRPYEKVWSECKNGGQSRGHEFISCWGLRFFRYPTLLSCWTILNKLLHLLFAKLINYAVYLISRAFYIIILPFKNYAQTLVDADRTSLFLVDNRTNELYARIFDIGGSLEDSRSSNLQKEIR